MATIQQALGAAALALSPFLRAQELDKAEVRIPYGELKQLLARAAPAAKPESPKPALLSARLGLAVEDGRPVINASFRAVSFGDGMEIVPLIGGGVSLDTQDPQDVVVLAENDTLCLATGRPGTQTLKLRLLPVISENACTLKFPPCPSVILETGELPTDRSVVLECSGREQSLIAGKSVPLPHDGASVTLRFLDSRETREALSPPEPSTWTWQHQALVMPAEGELIYRIVARATAAGGSGVAARLPMPPDARDIGVSGEDLVSHTGLRGGNRSLELALAWKTRGILDRQLEISYRMPLRPLDKSWRLQAPGGSDTRTRFIVADTPLLSYAADGLTGPFTAQGLPSVIATSLDGGTCHLLETATTADLIVTAIPVAVTAKGIVSKAEWSQRIEPDGAMLATGTMTIEHENPLGFVFDTPEGMKLLTCGLEGKPVAPVDLGDGRLMVNLKPHAGNSRLTCSFTGRTTALDPVRGTMKLTLPKTPLFLQALLWNLDLPAGYQAETHGNLKRTPAGQPSRITLSKNLCRDERPEVQVFYQRTDLHP